MPSPQKELRSLFSHNDFGAEGDVPDLVAAPSPVVAKPAEVVRSERPVTAAEVETEATVSGPIDELVEQPAGMVSRLIEAKELAAEWKARAGERFGLVTHLRADVDRWRGDFMSMMSRAEREYARRVELEVEVQALRTALEAALPASAEAAEITDDRDLRGADLRGADLRGADLRGANLGDASFDGATLRGASFRRADLRGADLRDADISGADARRLRLRKTGLQAK